MAARAIAVGSLSFRLLSVPVKLYSTVNTTDSISFNQLHAGCGTRLKSQLYCPKHDQVVAGDEIARGYEFAKGQFVVFSKEELEVLEAVGHNTVEIAEFVPATEINPVLIERTYYLGPDRGSNRAFKVMAEAMERTGLVGVGKYTARGKEHPVMLRPDGDVITLVQLKYANQVRSSEEVDVDEAPPSDARELKAAMALLTDAKSDTFDPARYRDETSGRVKMLIDQKVEGHQITAQPEAPQAQVIDLMEAIRQSMRAASEGKARSTSSRKKRAR